VVIDSLTADVFRTIDSASREMQTLLARLVAVPSENPPGEEYESCVRMLDDAAQSLGLRTERLPIAEDPPRAAVRASIGHGSPAVVLHGHYDVVPAVTRDQFIPRIEGDTLFGRGSSDMKSGLVAMLYAASALSATRALDRGTVELLFVPDEETGGAHGSGALAATGRLGVNAVGMVLGEPTSGRVWNASRGAVTLEVTVRGRSAHVGLQHLGINAVERAMPLLDALFALKCELDARGSVLLVGGRVDAGTNFNLVPESCRFTVDRRTNPDEDFDHERRVLFDLLNSCQAAGINLSVAVIQEGRSSSTPSDDHFGRILTGAIAEVCGEPAVVESCPGLLETRFYAERGIPAFAYGPGILAVSHGPNEFVKLSAVVACAKVYALTAMHALPG
jgi:acetylornithine deacetylase/succinyl-diaminopimelate desuccinylase family protein